jgi:transcriptional regulator with XRE-family HTH domain
MPGVKRTKHRIAGDLAAREAARRAGRELEMSRRRRHLTQAALAARVGVSRSRLADMERGKGDGVPVRIWFALGEALGRPFRAEFVRDTRDEPADSGHLAIQELVLGVTRPVGYEGRFELATRPMDPGRSTDVALMDRRRRRMVLVECWNTLGDLSAAARSSDRKRAEAAALATTLAGNGHEYDVGVCWVVRDTARNRHLLARYPHIVEARFPASSAAWARALTAGGPLPPQPGLIWCEVRSTRLFARRRARAVQARPATPSS